MASELEETLKSLHQNLTAIAKEFQSSLESIAHVANSLSKALEQFRKEYAPAIKEFSDRVGPQIHNLLVRVRQWQEEQKVSVSGLAEQGWFPNWYTFHYSPDGEVESLNELMIDQIDTYWDELKEKVLELSPKRKHILEVAFDLHERENYIASIPLFLTQSDGICSEEYSHFFSRDVATGRKASDEIIYQAETKALAVNFFSEVLLEPFKVDLQLSNSSSKSSKIAKSKGPNRHGIIHGSRKHLDYGTRVNSYKSLSFLAFIVYTTKDEFKKT